MTGKFKWHKCIKSGVSYAPRSMDVLVILDRQVGTSDYFYFPRKEWENQGGEGDV